MLPQNIVFFFKTKDLVTKKKKAPNLCLLFSQSRLNSNSFFFNLKGKFEAVLATYIIKASTWQSTNSNASYLRTRITHLSSYRCFAIYDKLASSLDFFIYIPYGEYIIFYQYRSTFNSVPTFYYND